MGTSHVCATGILAVGLSANPPVSHYRLFDASSQTAAAKAVGAS